MTRVTVLSLLVAALAIGACGRRAERRDLTPISQTQGDTQATQPAQTPAPAPTTAK